MERYSYNGPVEVFDRCVAHCWTATTYAISEKKAISNFKYQFKKQHNLIQGTRITLTGKITCEGD